MGAWHSALAYAVTGKRIDLGDQERPDLDVLVAALAERGLAADGLRRAVPADLMQGLSYAQLAAAERALRERLGATGVHAVRPSGRTRLDADERRLMADRPPHWG
ncbi:hypothetical protein GCM10027418_10240 [Mariniluteicoccus endophyticus]